MGNSDIIESFNKGLRLIEILSGIRTYTKNEIKDRFDNMSDRQFYRYISTLRDWGFIVDEKEGKYHIPKKSKASGDLSNLMHFSEEESYILNQAIHTIEASNTVRESLISKLSALYDYDRIAFPFITKENSSKIKPLLDAIENKKQVRLIDYQSNNGKISTRIVEPFRFTHNYIQIWCYEPESGICKTFKPSRIKKIEILSNKWKNEKLHKSNPLDCFRMADVKQYAITFEMTQKAYNLIIEEYPLSERFIRKLENDKYLFEGKISKPEGVGRFILGLPGEIFNIKGDILIEFLKNKLKKYDFF